MDQNLYNATKNRSLFTVDGDLANQFLPYFKSQLYMFYLAATSGAVIVEQNLSPQRMKSMQFYENLSKVRFVKAKEKFESCIDGIEEIPFESDWKEQIYRSLFGKRNGFETSLLALELNTNAFFHDVSSEETHTQP